MRHSQQQPENIFCQPGFSSYLCSRILKSNVCDKREKQQRNRNINIAFAIVPTSLKRRKLHIGDFKDDNVQMLAGKRAFRLSLKVLPTTADWRRDCSPSFCLRSSVYSFGSQRNNGIHHAINPHRQPYPRRTAPLGPHQPVARRPHRHHPSHPPETLQQSLYRHPAAPCHQPRPRRRPVPPLLRHTRHPRPIRPRVHIGHPADGIMEVSLQKNRSS